MKDSILKATAMEFRKTKRKSPILMILAVIVLNLFYLFVGIKKNDMQALEQAWESIFFYLPIMNTIFLSILMSVLASRAMDIEHKNGTWNVLQTNQGKKSIYFGKVLWGFCWLIIFTILEIGSSVGIAKLYGCFGMPSMHLVMITAAGTIITGMIIFQIQMALSLVFQNQFAALSISLFGTLIGLFGSYISSDLLLPWSLYGTLRALNMDYERGYEVAVYTSYTPSALYWLIAVSYIILSLRIGIGIYTKVEEGEFRLFAKRKVKSKSLHTTLPIEMIKLKRSPIWVAFIILPIISCTIGAFNFSANQDVLSFTWDDLWTQQSLFLGLFFLPPLLGIYCSLLWRMEHNGTNWNLVLTMESPMKIVADKLLTVSVISILCVAWIGFLFVVSGKMMGISDTIPSELKECMICGILGCIAISAVQIYLSLVIHSFALPVGIALGGSLIGVMFLAKGLGYFLPFSMLQMGLRSTNLTNEVSLGKFVVVSVIYIIAFYSLCVWHIKKRR